jgi:hypothetical protein
MIELKIRAISLPKYCPQCRRPDRFDAVSQLCGRCNNVRHLSTRRAPVLPSLWRPINYNIGKETLFTIIFMTVIFCGLGGFSAATLSYVVNWQFGTHWPQQQFFWFWTVLGGAIGLVYSAVREKRLNAEWRKALEHWNSGAPVESIAEIAPVAGNKVLKFPVRAGDDHQPRN